MALLFVGVRVRFSMSPFLFRQSQLRRAKFILLLPTDQAKWRSLRPETKSEPCPRAHNNFRRENRSARNER